MKLNATRSMPAGCNPPAVPTGLSGPESLAALLIESRRFQPTLTGPISNDGVQKLVNLVFFASLMPEEGRYPRYKLVCEWVDGSFFLVTRIDSLLLDGVNQIRRLAPACSHRDCALLVAERDGLLWCDGVMNIGDLGGMGYQTGSPRLTGVGRSPGLYLEVFGPGHLRVHETCFGGYEIRAGRLRALSAYFGPDPVQDLLKVLQARLIRDVCHRLGEIGMKYDHRVKDWHTSLHLLSRLLRTAADARHGGAFVFLPESRFDPAEYGLKAIVFGSKSASSN